MNIGTAARQSGLSAKMIRHYERTGLLRPVARTEGGYRQFSQRDIEVLRFIRRARLLGFSIPQIDRLIHLWQDPQRESRQVRSVARGHLDDVEHKLAELQQMKRTLQQLIDACHGDEAPDCAILDQLTASDSA
ncbi:MAG: Cu(I)-responsive transcriptional regulator [Pseudohongiellaceae bacterium]